MSRSAGLIAAVVLALVGLMALTDGSTKRSVDAAVAPAPPTESSDAPSPSTPSTSSPPTVTSHALEGLRTVDRDPVDVPPYDRDAFGPAWADVDRNGCNQRDDVLLRDVQPGTVVTQRQGRCDHDVLAGTWIDPYTGRTLTFTDLKDPKQSVAIQIDHVVPLAEAWRSGAGSWSPERRRDYANDVSNLLAVDGPTNQSKGSYDPASWRPRAAFQCAYATRWIDVKRRWDLGVDPSEARALTEMLATC